MILETLDKNQFAANKGKSIIEITEQLTEMQKQTLRRLFDKKVLLDSTAAACIEVARELGWHELADEMNADLQTELLTA